MPLYRYSYSLPFIWQFFFFILPVLNLVIISFRGFENSQIRNVFTIQNYEYLFSSKAFWNSLLNTTSIIFPTAFIMVLLAYPIAYFIWFYLKKHNQIILIGLLLVPMITNYILRTYSLKTILSDSGLINTIAINIGIISSPSNILYSYFAVMIGFVLYYFPIPVLFNFMSMRKIDKEVMDAAKNLGANFLSRLKYVVFPLSFSGAIFGFVFTSIFCFADFISPTILGGNELFTTSVMSS